MSDKPTVKQEIFPMFKQFFIEILGTVGFERFMDLLPVSERMILSQTPDPDKWIFSRSFSIILAAVDLHLTSQIDDFGFELGKYFVLYFSDEIFKSENFNSDFNPQNEFQDDLLFNTGELQKMGIEELRAYSSINFLHIVKIIKIYAKNLKLWFKPFEVDIDDRINNKNFTVILGERSINLPLFCEMFMGILIGILDHIHAGDATITKSSCIFDGDDNCRFDIYFDEQMSLDFI